MRKQNLGRDLLYVSVILKIDANVYTQDVTLGGVGMR